MRDDLKAYFLNPRPPAQRQYEALRNYVVDQAPAKQAARRFGFTEKSLYALAHDLRAGKLVLFPKTTRGPRRRRIIPYVRDVIVRWRKAGLSAGDIAQRLDEQGLADLSPSTVERVLREAGFAKLARRTAGERGRTKLNTLLAQPAQNLDFTDLKPFSAECQIAGLFIFLPYLIESGVLAALQALPVPHSQRIGKQQAFLSLLALKLTGGERLSHVRQYDHDVGLGVFAGLNVPPKPTYMGTYSELLSAAACQALQAAAVARMRQWAPALFSGGTINLDFHSIPHFGEQSEMEKVWCGARGKALKGANTFFAQDAETNTLLYANADVPRREASGEVLRFVDYWRGLKGVVDETLVFDARLTEYKILGELDKAGIAFITLRRRAQHLRDSTAALKPSQWRTVTLKIPKRKHPTFRVHQSEVALKDCDRPLRQIIIKDHGRDEPTYVITNNRRFPLAQVLTVYAQRWRIENKLAELVDFFNLNALSSPIMIRIHFDLLLSLVAGFFYSRLAADLPRFENHLAPDIFRRFIDMPGLLRFDGRDFEVRIRKRAHTPLLLGLQSLKHPVRVPWLDNRRLRVVFTP
jgi:hypothetical protein